jgi:AraC family transcriptional regulator
MEVRGPNGFRSLTAPPGSIWIAPAGEPVTVRLDSDYTYIRMMIAPGHLDSLLGHGAGDDTPLRLRFTFGISAAPAAYILRALAAESDGGLSMGLAYIDALTMALGRKLASHAGVTTPHERPFRGGLSPRVRRRVLELIDAKLDARLTIGVLAGEAGLSPAHFARAFKETMGRAPHQYMLALRLERARLLLGARDATISDVAMRTGFADQAHLTRFFRRRYGVTPGAYMRSRHGDTASV